MRETWKHTERALMPGLTFFQGGDGDPVGCCAAHVVIGHHTHLIAAVREQASDVKALPLPKEPRLHLPHRTSHRDGLQGLGTRAPHQKLTATIRKKKNIQDDA